MHRALGGAVFLLSLGTAAAGELTGVITQVSQTAASVQLRGPGVSPPPVAAPWRVIRAGVVVDVPEGGAVGVVCSTRQFVRVPGPASWRLDGRSCATGRHLTASQYALVAPQGGRLRSIRGFLVLQKEVRGDEDQDPLAPVVVSPRNTAIRTYRPSIRWFQVPSAVEYQIEWNGRGADTFKFQLDAHDLGCGSKELGVCELPWPAERPDLPAGRSFFLTIAARDDIVGPWHKLDAVEVRTLAADASEALGRRLRDLEDLGFEGGTREAARGAVLAQAGLYAEAAESCEQAIELAPAASLKVTLADIHFTTGLHRLAQPLYRETLEDEDRVIRAAAAFGMGRIEYAQARYREAALRFRQAMDLYGKGRLSKEKAAARRWRKEAEARVPK